MADKKMRLTESELKQVVEASVRQILMKEGFFKKAGDAIDRFENWADEKMEDFERGYDLKEGNPTSIFDVFKGNGWEPIKSKNGLRNGMNYVGAKKVRGIWGIAHGLTDEKLVEDINIFLDGRGHASLYKTVNDNYSILAIDAPLNLFEKAEVNESAYGDDGFESSVTSDYLQNNKLEPEVFNLVLRKGDEDEDGAHIYFHNEIIHNGYHLECIHTLFANRFTKDKNKLVVFSKEDDDDGIFDFDELPHNIQQQIYQDICEYEPEEYEEEYDDNEELY